MAKWKCEICGSGFENFHAQGFDNKIYCPLCYFKKLSADLQVENETLKKQLEYLRSGGYLNQLKFERNMLEDLVQNGEISKEDKDFIDMTHRNTELLEQQKEFIKYLEDMLDDENDIFSVVRVKDVLRKYKEIIGVLDEKK